MPNVYYLWIIYIRVTHNNFTQDFNAPYITGQVRFFGYGGNDSFNYHGSKNNYANGGAGNDYLSGDSGSDILLGGSGNDTIEGWSGNIELWGGDGNDKLMGKYGNNIISGDNGNDTLWGDAGNDLLGGGNGDAKIIGGAGIDVAFGGYGYDQYWEVGNDPRYYSTYVQTIFGWKKSNGGVQDSNGTWDSVWNQSMNWKYYLPAQDGNENQFQMIRSATRLVLS